MKTARQQMPHFGERMVCIHASESNPHRVGMFVKEVRRPRGGINAGLWWELTDGKGDFWLADPEITERKEA